MMLLATVAVGKRWWGLWFHEALTLGGAFLAGWLVGYRWRSLARAEGRHGAGRFLRDEVRIDRRPSLYPCGGGGYHLRKGVGDVACHPHPWHRRGSHGVGGDVPADDGAC